jgi:dienelactone hydrolase
MYEQERAKLLADLGYVSFAADIYGVDLQINLTIPERISLVTLYRHENTTLYFSRIQTAIDQVKSLDYVDRDNVAIIGYCFGGVSVLCVVELVSNAACRFKVWCFPICLTGRKKC